MELWQLYALMVLPDVAATICILAAVAIIVILFSSLLLAREIDEWRVFMKKIKGWIITLGCVFFLALFIPGPKTTMLIVGGYAATNIEGVEKLPPNMVKAANKFLEQFTEGKK